MADLELHISYESLKEKFIQGYHIRAYKRAHLYVIITSLRNILIYNVSPTHTLPPLLKRVCVYLQGQHTAMADIRESLKELKFYRKTIFKPPEKPVAGPSGGRILKLHSQGHRGQ